jgi:hypothetical protein
MSLVVPPQMLFAPGAPREAYFEGFSALAT